MINKLHNIWQIVSFILNVSKPCSRSHLTFDFGEDDRTMMWKRYCDFLSLFIYFFIYSFFFPLQRLASDLVC